MTTSYIPSRTAVSAGTVGAPPVPESRARRAADARAALPVHWYVRERWLVLLLGAFVPMMVALRLPLQLRAPLVWVSLITAAFGLVLLWCRTPGSTADDWNTEPPMPPAGLANSDAGGPSRATDAGSPNARHEARSRERA